MKIRVNGVGGQVGPVGASVQWEYYEGNKEVARRVLADLEDRRVLFYAEVRSDAEYCRRSADEIRQLMTKELPKVKQGDEMDRALRAIRRAAREFVDAAGPEASRYMSDNVAFNDALARLRWQISPHVRAMALAYDVLLEDIVQYGLPQHDIVIVTE